MAVAKLGAVTTLVRVVNAAPDALGLALTIVGVVSVAWGTIGALAQTGMRGLLGYSAISNGGFLALALATGPAGRHAAVLYVLVYAMTAMLTFAALDHDDEDLGLSELGRRRLSRGQSLALVVGLASFAGIPPTPGFWAKLAVLVVVAQNCSLLTTSIAIGCAVLGALYYLRPVPDLAAGGAGARLSTSTRLALAGAALALTVLMLAPFLAYRIVL
jgi:NADH-quinone oxidoreductase subunit N